MAGPSTGVTGWYLTNSTRLPCSPNSLISGALPEMQPARALVRAAALLALCLALPLVAAAWPAADDSSPEAELARWLERRGGSLVRAGRARSCSRGPWHACPLTCHTAIIFVSPLASMQPARRGLRHRRPPPLNPLLPQPGFALRQACPTCLRGVAASRALAEGDLIVAVPPEAVLELG